MPPAGLDAVSARYESVRGTVAGDLELDVTVPPTATGRVYLPATSAEAVTELDGSDAVRFLGVEAARVVYEVRSGSYRFRVAGRE